MKKILQLMVGLLMVATTLQAQVLPHYYRNLEKYWFYRYRLVNDFMKIGPNQGESIPIGNREIDRNNDSLNNTLKFSDATQSLGHYIGVLATEHKLLDEFHWPTARTEMELWYANHAFERLDLNAERYCRNIRNPAAPLSGDLNGFFIRDDADSNLLIDNFNHFNRPGVLHKVYHLNSDYKERRDEAVKLGEDFFSNGAPRYPYEESQDQVAELFLGLSLASEQVNGNASFNGEGLAYKSTANLNRMLSWIPHDEYWGINYQAIVKAQTLEHEAVNLSNSAALNFQYVGKPIPYWNITNPLTHNCVYGTNPGNWSYLNSSLCSGGGALFFPSAYPAAEAARALGVNFGINYGPYSDALPYKYIYEELQNLNLDYHADISFTDDFATSGDDTWGIDVLGWVSNSIGNVLSWLGINTSGWFQWAFISTQWKTIRNHSMTRCFWAPHTPLIYRLQHYQFGCGGNWCSNCHGGGYSYQSDVYQKMLNAAPNCGPFNYQGDYHNPSNDLYKQNWSGYNRLLEPAKRDGVYCTDMTNSSESNYHPSDYKTDYSGLDYMFLFNLYSSIENNLHKMINPYYTENFNTNYPDADGYGSHTKPLQLNYLEFLSAKDKIHSDGHLTVRGAKVIELLPGFEAETNSHFEAYIQDYTCADFRDEEGDNPFHYALLEDTGTHIQTAIEYSPDKTPHGGGYRMVNDAKDNLADSLLTPEIEQAYFEYLRTGINKQNSSEQMALLNKLIAKSNMPNNFVVAGDYVMITPNPNHGQFSIKFSVLNNYTITIINMAGTPINKFQNDGLAEYNIDLGSVPSGDYVVKIVGNNNTYIKKIIIY